MAYGAVTAKDGMTADFAHIPFELLGRIPTASSMRFVALTVSLMTSLPNLQRQLNGSMAKPLLDERLFHISFRRMLRK